MWELMPLLKDRLRVQESHRKEWRPTLGMWLPASPYNLMACLKIHPQLLCLESQFTSSTSVALSLRWVKFYTQCVRFRILLLRLSSLFLTVSLFGGQNSFSCMSAELWWWHIQWGHLNGFLNLCHRLCSWCSPHLPATHTPTFYQCID